MNEIIPLDFNPEPADQPERSDALANRRRILAATRALFDQHGPAGVTMSDIVKAAGVGRGTLYRHYPTKGELCLAVMDEEIADFQNEVLAHFRRMTDERALAMERLDYFLDRLVYFTERYAPLLREAQRQGLPYLEKKEGTPQPWEQATVAALLRAAGEGGEIPAGLDHDYLADALLAPLNAQLFFYQRDVRDFSPQRISAGLRGLVGRLRR
jgi:AcrR family transcriptional regulator